MLTNLDDYPIHQTSEPMRHAATSDRNFYDRYYFNGFDHDGTVMFVVGLGVYPNLGVIDAFLLVFHEGQHRVVRASGALDSANRLQPSVGPLGIEVIEPLQTLRVRCADNEWGITLDATWTGSMPAFEEPRHYIRENGRTIFDTMRLAQTGGWQGTLTIPGSTFTLSPQSWWGTRDRSWGIRPVGESEPAGIRASNPFSWFWIYTPIRFADHSLMIIMQERPDGSRVMEEATRIWNDGRIEHLGWPDHALRYRSGTRFAEGGDITISAPDGHRIDLEIEPLVPVHIGIGTGYGYDADWRHGMWQGPLKVEHFALDTTKPEDAARLFGIVDASARFRYTDREGRRHEGYGLFETMAIGPHQRYGFVDMLDGYAGE
ncbi:MAG: hypothetical protein ACO3SP_07310 [Ilumatobacteraceae bacterium]